MEKIKIMFMVRVLSSLSLLVGKVGGVNPSETRVVEELKGINEVLEKIREYPSNTHNT